MQAATMARDARLNRDEGGTNLPTADPHCDASNPMFRPRAGNISGDTRAGLTAR
jgi:uncharacterized protein (DUF779 family)